MATFRARLRKARTVRKVTLAALAKTLGTYSTNVSAWQNAKPHPGLGYRVGLADALDVTTDWLTGRSDRGGPRRRKKQNRVTQPIHPQRTEERRVRKKRRYR